MNAAAPAIVAVTSVIVSFSAVSLQPLRSEGGTISGEIRFAASLESPARLIVELIDREHTRLRPVRTDEQGRFVARDLPVGRYEISVLKPGFIQIDPATGLAGNRIVAIRDHASVSNVLISLERGGAISGVIVNAMGFAATGVPVRLYRVHNLFDGQTLGAAAGNTRTDDRGAYQFVGLAAGFYAVAGRPVPTPSASVPRVNAAEVDWAFGALGRGGLITQPPAALRTDASALPAETLFPGIPTFDGTSVIALQSGELRSDINITLCLAHTLSITGAVVDASGQAVQVSQVMLGADGSSTLNGPPSIHVGSDGRFSRSGFLPGVYRLIAGGKSPTSAMWAVAAVTITDQDVQDLVLRLQPAAAVTGLVEQAESPGAPGRPVARAEVRLRRAGASVAIPDVDQVLAVTQADGRFAFEGLAPGRYSLDVSARAQVGSPRLTIQRLVVDGAQLMDPIVVAGSGQLVNIAITTGPPAELYGALFDAAGRPATGYSVVVFPSAPELRIAGSPRLRFVRAADDGSYSFATLPAGKYFVAAVANGDADAVLDISVLQRLEAFATEVAIQNRERRRLDLSLVGRTEAVSLQGDFKT